VSSPSTHCWARAGRLAALAGSLIAAAAGCGSDEDDRPATFSYVYATVLEPNCTTVNCHSSYNATQGLELDDLEKAYQSLIGRTCAQGPDPDVPPVYIDPGDPDGSQLKYLLTGDNVNVRMPPDTPLPEADIALVERWIAAGAECN
jgi:hypothetical protein